LFTQVTLNATQAWPMPFLRRNSSGPGELIATVWRHARPHEHQREHCADHHWRHCGQPEAAALTGAAGRPGTRRAATSSTPSRTGRGPVDRRLLRYATAARGYLIATVALGLVGTLLILAQASLLARLLSTAAHGQVAAALAGSLTALLVVVAGRAAVSYAGEVAALRASATVKSQLRRALIARSLRLGPVWLGGQRAAAISTALVAVEVGLRLPYGHLGYETALLALLLTPEAFLPLRAVGAQFHASMEGAAAARSAFEILDTPVPDEPQAGSRRSRRSANADLRTEEIRLNCVTAVYPGRSRPDLDEVSLDPESLAADLLTLTTGRTTLLITHELEGLGLVDEIVVLDQGQVVQRGTHEQLLRAGGPYRQLQEASSFWPVQI
jgi:ABC-type transport system involved in cytochrome bd biosynthesis fused ATPase/permease subunit